MTPQTLTLLILCCSSVSLLSSDSKELTFNLQTSLASSLLLEPEDLELQDWLSEIDMEEWAENPECVEAELKLLYGLPLGAAPAIEEEEGVEDLGILYISKIEGRNCEVKGLIFGKELSLEIS
ncbi:hypothetical protein WICPIJ_009452 [Wickerhamomyces pijperi]|uniref:Uncharacterized protein n=1 Tax=Wickerhamomyces pijperi TaxID=599730 RepID=A0A9P8PMN1_WICPI|nr:hypothetical protein WICPIJ_009452 [Wickerhamomyces pijperi]